MKIAAFVFFCLLTSPAFALTDDELQKYQYRPLVPIEKFGWIKVTTYGTAEDIGLHSNELTDLLRLRFKNNFAGTKYESFEGNYPTASEQPLVGSLWCSVWTIENKYPIPFHIKCGMGPLSNTETWHNEILGVGDKSRVPERVKRFLNELAEEAAIAFLKARGEM
jgi:hypothetical protein